MQQQLISTGVITYNSSKYILEALDSIKNQTYQNIELIISDDGSTDNTIELCKEWINENGSRFVRTEIIVPPHNTGTAGNCNRLMKACHAKWVKYIAGDDKMKPECIEIFSRYISLHPNEDIIFSNIEGIGDLKAARDWPFSIPRRIFKEMTPDEIEIALCYGNFLPAASVCLKKECWKSLGGYEESIPLLEDWPLWVKAYHAHKKIGYLDETTVEYRFSDDSISQQQSKTFQKKNNRYEESNRKSSEFAFNSMPRISLGAWFYYKTTHGITFNSLKWKLVHYWNFFNPYFYKQRRAMYKWRHIIDEMRKDKGIAHLQRP